jgi:hypothetical protein
VSLTRWFRGSQLEITIEQNQQFKHFQLSVDGEKLEGNLITNIEAGKQYSVNVAIPITNSIRKEADE